MTCTFFGHRDTPDDIRIILEKTIEGLITDKSVNHFYIGNHGNFDLMALQCIIQLQQKYPHIRYEIVLAYIPSTPINHPTLFPEGIEHSPKKFAICFRNKWMVNHTDYVVSHIRYNYGGAYQFTRLAKNQGKIVISI